MFALAENLDRYNNAGCLLNSEGERVERGECQQLESLSSTTQFVK